MAKGKPYFVLALLVILAAALVGCDGELGVYTVSGTVWEEDSGNPLAGAAVTLGEQRTVTNAQRWNPCAASSMTPNWRWPRSWPRATPTRKSRNTCITPTIT